MTEQHIKDCKLALEMEHQDPKEPTAVMEWAEKNGLARRDRACKPESRSKFLLQARSLPFAYEVREEDGLDGLLDADG
jgi:hypothetical protein